MERGGQCGGGNALSRPIGKLLVGLVAEVVLRIATVPLGIVGHTVVEGTYRNASGRTILCAVDTHVSSAVVAKFTHLFGCSCCSP